MRQHLLIGSMLIATLGAFYYFVVDQQVIPGQGETIAQRYEKRNAEEAARPRTRHNGTIQKPYAGCLTEAALDEAVGAAVKNDTRQLQALLVSGLTMGRLAAHEGQMDRLPPLHDIQTDWSDPIAPSDALRRWFGHDAEKWAEFGRRYREELRRNPDAVAALRREIGDAAATLVYAAHDEAHNNALVLRDFLLSRTDD